MLQVLVEHGHDKNKVLNEYSRDEAVLFFEKCVKQDMRRKADDIEGVMVGIGGAFGGGKHIKKILESLRE